MFHASPALLAKLEAKSKSSSTLPPDQRAFLDAAVAGDAAKIRELLARGVPVDVREDFCRHFLQSEQTALMYAAANGHLETVQILLKAGASVTAVDKNLSRDDEGGQTPLHYAARQKNSAVIEELCNAAADVNALTTRGNTPLNRAIWENNLEAVVLLIHRGTNLSSRIGRKKAVSPLCAAIDAVRNEVPPETIKHFVLLLLEAGADPNGTGELNASALAKLAGASDIPSEISTPLMESFVEAGAKPDLPDKDGQTALTSAVRRSNPDAVSLLLKAGADVNRVFIHRGSTVERSALDLNELELRDRDEDVARRARKVGDILRAAGGRKKSELP